MNDRSNSSLMNEISIPVSNLTKCIACIIIAMHHYAQLGIDKGYICGPVYSILRSNGDMFVTLFFFLSGYGLMASETRKHLGIVEFLKKRLWRLLKPFWIANVIFVALYWIFGVGNVATESVGNAVLSCLGITMFDGTMWFVHVLLMLYVVFTVSSQIKEKTLFVMSFFILGFILVSIFLELPSFYWVSIYAFPAGMALFKYKEIIFPVARKWFVPVLSVLLYAVLLYTLIFKLNLDPAIWHQLNNLLVVVLFVFCVSHLNSTAFHWFKLPQWLDAYYELYLVHAKMLYLIFLGFGVFMPLLLFLGLSISAAIALHFLIYIMNR